MSVLLKSGQILGVFYGTQVTGGAKTLPASTSGSIFTVTGGRVIVTSLMGVVTTAIQNQACTMSIGGTPSGGSEQTTELCAAASVSNLAVGVTVGLPLYATAQLLVSANPGVLSSNETSALLGGTCMVNTGTIDVTTSATNTGAITWSMTYIPYDVGAVVAAD
jgi:hypothetical protein